MINTAIVDGNAECAEKLRKITARYFEEHGHEYEIRIFTDVTEFVKNYRPVFDLVMTETEFPHLNGIQAAERLRRADRGVCILFVTATEKYAVSGYEAGVFDYVLKPVEYESFAARLDRAMERVFQKAQERSIFATVDGVRRRLLLRDVRYIEVRGHMLVYHLHREVVYSRGRLEEEEAKLREHGFFRIYKCYLVNLFYVQEIRQTTAIVDGDELMVSRFRKKEFIAAVDDYYRF